MRAYAVIAAAIAIFISENSLFVATVSTIKKSPKSTTLSQFVDFILFKSSVICVEVWCLDVAIFPYKEFSVSFATIASVLLA